jgi:hypothetical protein
VRRLVFVVIALVALFTALRAYTQGTSAAGNRYILQPGVLEFQSAEGGASVAFGFLERSAEQNRQWNLFPVRLSLHSGKQSFLIAVNGLSLLGPGGLEVGRPVTVSGVRRGDVISVGGPVTVQGRVEGDVWTLGADIKLLSGSVVTGNAVALGGRVLSDRGSEVRGNKQSLPAIKVPFIGLLSSAHSVATLRALIELLGVCLYLLVLFLVVHFAGRALADLSGVLFSAWRGVILYLVLAALLVPVVTALLVASILGIVLLPFLAVALVTLAYLGYVGLSVRLGVWMQGRDSGGTAARAGQTGATAYTAGLLGLLVLKGPLLLGILFTLLDSEFFRGVGRFLSSVGTVAVILAALYGLGGVLRFLRMRATRAA